MTIPKRIGFLSFGAWHPGGGLTHTGDDALRQTVELAVAAEKIGIDGAFVRVHHFALRTRRMQQRSRKSSVSSRAPPRSKRRSQRPTPSSLPSGSTRPRN
jgi:alkanesulfonate monooxygenase SsuD/methylene tetrahydromethanopterin reductase-like flavin-dependent oxidoreductase (luciferase family)